MRYHAVLIDETGCEFSRECEAVTEAEARGYFRDQYPESRVVWLETVKASRGREQARYDRLVALIDSDMPEPY